MRKKVHYSFCFVDACDLNDVVSSFNKYEDKIVAVTQHQNTYTIFYEDSENEVDGDA